MRLHRLELTAFGPYAGTECVDFDALASHGIFLLTGPTGAGKTSVLDAIAFALFGAVPGARQHAKRLRSDHAAADVRTQVTLELSIRGRRLRITRLPEQLRPKQRGTGTTTEKARAVLEEWTGDHWLPLSSRLDEIGEHVATLLGMSREQFCQVVLLPQGEFAAFLRADASQRGDLLQRLFATERFERVEAQLRHWRNDAAAAAATARADVHDTLARLSELGGIDRADDGDILEWADEIRDSAHKRRISAAGECAAVRTTAQRARDRHKAAEELATLQQQYDNALRRRSVLDERRADIVLAEHELGAARRAATVTPLLTAATDAAAAHASAAASVADARADLAAAEAPDRRLTEAATKTLVTAVARLHEEGGALGALLDLEHEVIRRLREAEQHDAAAAEAAERARDYERRLTDHAGEKALRDQRLLVARERATLVEPCRHAVRTASERVTAAKQRDALVVRRSGQRELLAVLVDRAQDARERLFDLREARINGMAGELAEDLIPGQPCPVCGSDEHPTPAPTTDRAVSGEDEQLAHDEWNVAEQERRQADERLRALDAELAAARAGAGGDDPIESVQAALTAARAALAEAEEAAGNVGALTGAVTALESERAEAERERSSWLQRQQVALTAASEQRRFVREASTKLADARGDDSSVAARAERLRLLADRVEAVVRAEHDEHEARTNAKRARRAAQDAALTAGFDGVDDAADAARDPDRSGALATLVEGFKAEEAKVAEHLDNPTLITAAAAPRIDPAIALAELDDLETQLRALDGEHGAAQKAAIAVDRLHEQLMEQLDTLRPLDERVAVVTAVSQLADGTSTDNERRMTLSSYVLAARLEQVAAAATVRLLQMSGGRYSLVHTDERDTHGKRSGLGLAVVDGWTGQQRPTVTLSGGESFFASLALALGLADVAAAEAGGARLETLFVDEGFGSLDDETLDEVMTVLDGLRDGGRVIGIVSHLADLRQRIPAQLDVTKTATGSTLAPADRGNL